MRHRLMAFAAMLAWSLLLEWPSGHLKLELAITHHAFIVEYFPWGPRP